MLFNLKNFVLFLNLVKKIKLCNTKTLVFLKKGIINKLYNNIIKYTMIKVLVNKINKNMICFRFNFYHRTIKKLFKIYYI